MNTTPPATTMPDAAALELQLSQDIAACQQLLTLMQAEREALRQRDADALGVVIEEKAHHLQHLEQSAAFRTEWAKQAQGADPDTAWYQLLEDLQQPQLKPLWEQLKALMAQCREENEASGKILARSQHTFGRLLNIMRGQTDAPSLYTQKGARSGGSSSQTFGEV